MNQNSNSVLTVKLCCAPGLCLCSVFSLLEVIIVSSHTSWKPCPNLCVRSPWTSPQLTARSVQSPCLILINYPQFPSGVSAVDKIGFSPVLEQQNLGGDVAFSLVCRTDDLQE